MAACTVVKELLISLGVELSLLGTMTLAKPL